MGFWDGFNARFVAAYLATLILCLSIAQAGREVGHGLSDLGRGTAVQSEKAVEASFRLQAEFMKEQLQQLRRCPEEDTRDL